MSEEQKESVPEDEADSLQPKVDTTKSEEFAIAFVKSIQALYLRGENGKLAALRRAAGEPFGSENARNVFWFYDLLARFVPANAPDRQRQEQTFFLVATLLAYDRTALEGRGPATPLSFGQTIARLKPTGTSAGADTGIARRFRILLDATREPDGTGELPFRLRQMVRLALSKGASIHWPTLLIDLLRWEHPSRRTQKDWARDFFTPGAVTPDPADAPTTDDETGE